MTGTREQGTFDGTGLGEILARIWNWKFTGTLRVDYRKSMRIYTFKSGEAIGLTSDQREDMIEEFVRKAGMLSDEQIAAVLERKPLDQDSAAAFVKSGLLTPREWSDVLRRQIVTVTAGMLPAGVDGSYQIQPSQIEWDGPSFPVPEVLLAAVMACEDRHWLAEKLPMDTVFDSGILPEPGLVQPYEDAARMLSIVDGDHSVEEICTGSTHDNFYVCKFLYAMELLGVARRQATPGQRKKGRRLLVRREETGPPEQSALFDSLAARRRPAPRVIWMVAGIFMAAMLGGGGAWYLRHRHNLAQKSPQTQPAAQTQPASPSFFVDAAPATQPSAPTQTQAATTSVDPLFAAVRLGDLETAATLGRERMLKAGLNYYVIVLETDCRADSVQTAFRAGGDSAPMFVLASSYPRPNCYNVCWGLYRDWREAQAEMGRLPGYFKQQGGASIKALAELLVND